MLLLFQFLAQYLSNVIYHYINHSNISSMNMRQYALLFVATALLASNCKKKEEIDFDTATIADNSTADNVFDDVFRDATDKVAEISNGRITGTDSTVSGCPTVTFFLNENPKRILIDYGNTPCLGGRGNYKKGKINVTYTGRYRDVGTVITTTFDNFYVNDYKVEGKQVVTHTVKNQYEVKVSDTSGNGFSTLTKDNEVITWKSNRTRKWRAGESTIANWQDDEYEITGNGEGTNRNGRKFTATITRPLLIRLSCWNTTQRFYPVSGTISIKPENLPERIIDYGSGACDKIATISANNQSLQFTMR
jgi:hypothetical protein